MAEYLSPSDYINDFEDTETPMQSVNKSVTGFID